MRLRLLYGLLVFLAFGSLNAQDTLGIVGSATPNGWDGPDLVMTEVADTVGLFEANVTLMDGEVKFRVNNDWTVNWGNSDFPAGVGVAGGPNIPVNAGDYYITFDTVNLNYSFTVQSPIGIIGDAIPGTEWSEDVNMFEDTNGVFFIDIELVQGGAKFRKDDMWDVSWGADTFPSGFATSVDGPNIPVDKAGTYHVTFDTATGFFNFEEMITYSSIGIIGSATENGWDGPDVDLVQNDSDPNLWEGNITLGEGEIKFRANDEWEIDWGGSAFPTDTAVLKGDNITVIPGEYLVKFNTESLVYEFLEVINYSSIGIIGDAVDGWDADDRDMMVSETDSAIWTLRTILNDGELKFRADNAWDISWGSGDFPSGVAGLPGTNIPITAGEYVITFNTTTREYDFKELIIFSTVGIVGTATPLMSWDEDVDMTKDAVDEQLWTITTDLVDGEMKFRAEDAWTVNWGNDEQEVLVGTGTQDGANILITAGNYFITLRSDDGSYSIQPPSSVHNQSILSEIKVFPNPTDNFINIELDSELISGLVNVEVLDVTGKKVLSTSRSGNGTISIDVSNIPAGTYYLKMFNKEFLVAKPISVK